MALPRAGLPAAAQVAAQLLGDRPRHRLLLGPHARLQPGAAGPGALQGADGRARRDELEPRPDELLAGAPVPHALRRARQRDVRHRAPAPRPMGGLPEVSPAAGALPSRGQRRQLPLLLRLRRHRRAVGAAAAVRARVGGRRALLQRDHPVRPARGPVGPPRAHERRGAHVLAAHRQRLRPALRRPATRLARARAVDDRAHHARRHHATARLPLAALPRPRQALSPARRRGLNLTPRRQRARA
mmetsp:Transcript_78075/g.233990  ORF Transcript_78075/g.233990 Transcript_78075/m.233990 type:complete len:243 (+) Transcript_78075:36-764(+)